MTIGDDEPGQHLLILRPSGLPVLPFGCYLGMGIFHEITARAGQAFYNNGETSNGYVKPDRAFQVEAYSLEGLV